MNNNVAIRTLKNHCHYTSSGSPSFLRGSGLPNLKRNHSNDVGIYRIIFLLRPLKKKYTYLMRQKKKEKQIFFSMLFIISC